MVVITSEIRKVLIVILYECDISFDIHWNHQRILVKRLDKQKTEFDDSFHFSYSELSIGRYCRFEVHKCQQHQDIPAM